METLKVKVVREKYTEIENGNTSNLTVNLTAALAKKIAKDGMSTKDIVIGEVIRRAVNHKVADMERLKTDLQGVIDEMADQGDALAKLLHDASELPKLKLAEQFMN